MQMMKKRLFMTATIVVAFVLGAVAQNGTFEMVNLYRLNSGDNPSQLDNPVPMLFFPDSLAKVAYLQRDTLSNSEETGPTFIDRNKVSALNYSSIALTFDPYSKIFGNGLTGDIAYNRGYSIDSIRFYHAYDRYYTGADQNDIVDTVFVTIGMAKMYPTIDVDEVIDENLDDQYIHRFDLIGVPYHYTSLMLNLNTELEQGIGSSWTNTTAVVDTILLTADDVTPEGKVVRKAIKLDGDKIVKAMKPGYITAIKFDYKPGHIYQNGDIIAAWNMIDSTMLPVENPGEEQLETPTINCFQLAYAYAAEADKETADYSQLGRGFYDQYGYNGAGFVPMVTRYGQQAVESLTDKTQPFFSNIMPFVWIHYTENANGDENGTRIYDGTDAIRETAALISGVYPNPAKDFVTVRLANEGEAQIDIVNTLGQTVKSVAATRATNTISTADLKAGLYIVRVMQGNQVSTAKLSVK